ncbi:MAG: hypothetical protein SPL65_05955 [Lachnospiraceae bacterium]|nr:hypothetical protein [Lachnospiraceae bacterium]
MKSPVRARNLTFVFLLQKNKIGTFDERQLVTGMVAGLALFLCPKSGDDLISDKAQEKGKQPDGL